MSSKKLFRNHLFILAGGVVLHYATAAPILYVAFEPLRASDGALLLILLLGTVPAVLVDIAAVLHTYAPLRTLDRLGSHQLYAQNNDLSRGVVRLYNLPLFSFVRVYCVRAVFMTVCIHLLLVLNNGPAAVGGSSAVFFWLLNLTFVPLPAAALELFALPPVVESAYREMLSYREILPPGWRRRIRFAGTGLRMVVVVAVLAAAPMVALAVRGSGMAPSDPVLLAGCSLIAALFVALLAYRDGRRSIAALLEGMRQVGKNRPTTGVTIVGSDEQSVIADGFSQMIAGLKEQSFIRDTFGKYVPKAIVEAVLRDGVNLRGESREVAIMLVEIPRFHTRIERQSPEDTIALLNKYLGMVIAASQHFGGTIDKVAGDRVLVVFGAPVTLNAPVERALLSALEIRKGAAKLNAGLGAGHEEPLRIGIQVHYGGVVAGHVGAAERWEYSVIGGAVNEIFRISEISCRLEPDIIVSGTARALAGEMFIFAPRLALAGNPALELYPLSGQTTQTGPSGSPAV